MLFLNYKLTKYILMIKLFLHFWALLRKLDTQLDHKSARSQTYLVCHLADFPIYYEYLGNDNLILLINKLYYSVIRRDICGAYIQFWLCFVHLKAFSIIFQINAYGYPGLRLTGFSLSQGSTRAFEQKKYGPNCLYM